VELGQDEGAKVAVGGRRPPHLDRGFFYEPTILTGVANDHRVAREEIFGPVLSVIPYEGGDDVAVELANDSPFGLHGAVFTADRERGLQVADRVRAGTFTVNGYVLNEAAPFGGVKASGVGREFGPEGLDEYVELRTINVPLDAAPDADG
jgi:betaine-aldehyde dehydrogenase